MSERYSKVFSLPENLYAEGAPVVIAAGALLKDNQTGRVVTQLKLRNISPKTIKAVTVRLFPMNTAGQPLGDAVSYEYLDLSSPRDADFGSKSAIPMPDKTTRSFGIRVAEVIFADNSVWNANDTAWEPLKKPEALDSRLDGEMVKQFRMEYGSRAKSFLLEQKDLWHCVCGAVNRQGETVCHSCQKSIYDLKNLDLETLKEHKEQRVAREQEQAEKKAAATQKTIKVLATVLIVAAVFCIAASFANDAIKKNHAYNSAIAMIDAKQYDEAIAILQELADYKDSAQQIQIAKEGKQEMAYAKAVALLEEKDYKGAVSAFEALGKYRDSANLLIESNYQYAMELIAQEDFAGAHSVLRTIPEYKDAAEYLSHMYMVPQKITSTIDRGREDAFFYFGYNSDGKMNEAREVVGTSSWSFSFSEDGVFTDLYDLSGERILTYVTTSNGLVTSYDMSGEAYRYDEHGNLIAGKWVEHTGRKYDEHGNRTDNSTNVYGAAGDHKEMNLQSVCRDDELMVQSNFSYTYLYSPNEDVDMDLIWKNVRIICSGWVWG